MKNLPWSPCPSRDFGPARGACAAPARPPLGTPLEMSAAGNASTYYVTGYLQRTFGRYSLRTSLIMQFRACFCLSVLADLVFQAKNVLC